MRTFLRWLMFLSKLAVITLLLAVVIARTGGRAHSLACTSGRLVSSAAALHPLTAPYGALVAEALCPAPRVMGTTSPGYEEVRRIMEEAAWKGEDSKAQVAVYKGNRLVVDLALDSSGSHAADPEGGLYGPSSVQMCFSTGKNLEALVVAMLVDAGRLDYGATVGTYWPEFAAGGKGNITVADVMRHDAGLCVLDAPVSLATVRDPELLDRVIERQQYQFHGPSGRCYHAITRGYILRGLVRRADRLHRTVYQFLKEEVVPPLGLQDEVALSLEADHPAVARRVMVSPLSTIQVAARLLAPWLADKVGLGQHVPFENQRARNMMGLLFDPDHIISRSVQIKEYGKTVNPTDMQTFESMSAEMSSANVVASARAMAKMASALANNGEVGGLRLFSNGTATMQTALGGPVMKYDLALEIHPTFVRGGWAKDLMVSLAPNFCDKNYSGVGDHIDKAWCEEKYSGWYGWPGYGGSYLAFNPERRMSFVFLMNIIGLDDISPRAVALLKAAIDADDRAK